MAIVKEQVVSQRGSGGDRTAASIAVASGDILIAIVTTQDSNTNNLGAATVKFNGTEDFTKVIEAGGSGGSGQPNNIQIWRLNNPTATTANVVADCSTGINESTITVFRLSGADTTTPINGTPDSDTGSGFAPAMSITTDTDSCFLIGGLCSEPDITGVGTGQTSDSDLTDQSYENTVTSSEAGGTAGAQTHSYNMGSGGPYAQACVAIKPAGASNSAPTIAPNTADATDFATDTTPTLEFTGSDTDGDNLTYEIQIDNNSDLSSPLLSKASNADSGFANTVTGGDTDPFNAGEKISFTVQAGDALTPGTWYWRARVKDPSGSNTYSSYTSIRSFIVRALPTVTTQAASSVADTTVTGNGNLTNLGNDTVTKRGFVYDTATHSDPGNVAPGSSGYAGDANDTSAGYSTGAYTKNITGLTQGTTYYMRAYVQNGQGYDYGDEVSFSTTAPSDILDTTAAWEGGGSQNTFANAMTIANNSNRALVASISVQDSNHSNLPVIQLKWGTQDFTKIRHDEHSSNVRSELWLLLNPDAGTQDLFIQCNGAVWKGVVLTSLKNIKQQAPNANTGDTGTSTSPSKAITVAENDSVVIDAISSEAARSALGASQTSNGTEQGQSYENVSSSRKENIDIGSSTMSATIGSSAPWAISVMALTTETGTGTAELRLSNVPLVAAHVYLLRMWMRATREQTINVKVQDSALGNQAANENRLIPADTWTPFNFEFTAVATDPNSKVRITLNMSSVQDFYIDKVRLIDLTVEKKQYRIMRIQGSMLPGSFVQTLTLREKTSAETA